jgi:hypothetical protein
MKNEFVIYKENSTKPIIVNETTNTFLLKRCQDCWYHTLDIRYLENKKWLAKIGINKLKGKEKHKTDFLFLHIPKTGGISFKFNVIYNPHMDKKISIYHKINYPPKKYPEIDILEQKKKMFTILREPTDTVISSCYHFNHIVKMNLQDFCEQFTNMQTKFLLGYDIFSSIEINENHFLKIKKLIDKKTLVVGIHQTKKMNEIYDLLDLPMDKVDRYVLNKKKYLSYKPSDISTEIKKRIRELNDYDYRLFEYVLNS